MITRFIERASRGEPPIIYGDGEQTRDFIHVEDVAEAIKLAIERGLGDQTLNIASCRPTKIGDLAGLIIRQINPDLKPVHTRPRSGKIKHSHADIQRARALLGFRPKITLEQGIKTLIPNPPHNLKPS